MLRCAIISHHGEYRFMIRNLNFKLLIDKENIFSLI